MTLREMVEQAGGLVTLTMMGTRWGLSRERARQLSKLDGFPAPVQDGLWAWNEVNEWRIGRAA